MHGRDGFARLEHLVLTHIGQVGRDQADRCGAEAAGSLCGKKKGRRFCIRVGEARQEDDVAPFRQSVEAQIGFAVGKAAQVNVGNVAMLKAEWNDVLIGEKRVFPNGSHDDQVDAGADAFDELNINNFGMLDFMQQMAQQAQEQKNNDSSNQNQH